MCGIVGIYIFNNTQKHKLSHIDNAVAKMNMRGPDALGSFTHNQTALGHARLSVIDTSENANQPFVDCSGRYTIIFNGEFYNYKQYYDVLKSKGYSFKTQSDTEVLLYLYIEYGKKCLEKINGFFAFAIYDSIDNTIFIARDRMGIKPLNYYLDDNIFVFASEIKSILEFGINKEIDNTALFSYLQLNYTPAPKTIFKNISKLSPGKCVLISNNSINITQYYTIPKPLDNCFNGNYEQAKKQFRSLMEKSVQLRMVSDVPLGSFLSGGIDSSIIAGLASQYTDKLNTFSIGYKDEPFFDETKYAKLVADKFKTEHTVFSLTKDDITDNIFDILDYIDEPFADSSAIAVYILSKKTKKEVTVALSGDGADELFSGYNKHSAHLRASKNNILNGLIKNTNSLWQNIGGSRNSKLGNITRQLLRYSNGLNLSHKERYWRWCALASEQDIEKLLNCDINYKEYSDYKNTYTNLISTENINDVLYADTNLVLPYDMLHKVDMMSMANGLEVRTPFLDYNIVEFANSLPQEYKINNNIRKKIVQDTFKDFLPSELYNRSKHGFEIPLFKLYKTDLKPFIENEVLNNDFIQEQNIFNVDEIKTLKQRLNSSNPGEINAQLWALIVFQHWYKKYFI